MPVRVARSRGFSLLEVLMVVALIAVASVLAVGVLGGGIERLQLRSSAKELAANLRFTRAHALATGAPQRFVIDPVAHTWQGPAGRQGSVPDTLDIVFTGAREVQPRTDQGAIVFFDDGASTGGRVQLRSGDVAWNVDVAWLTGEVRLHRGERRR
ncbi:type II secretion system protein XpsH [Luteimonas salinilitoris]|uniref:Type II secretion system protein H n=1 Tax=Luteimonas salinilitoris TaxID=3237697 RepID=A0ABV4HNX6_9GAMM